MPNVIRTREETIGLMLGYLGTSWPNPWWPTGSVAYDDCAACVSWALFGLNGDQPYQTYVSGVIERSGLTFYPGSYGIQRGDAIGFLWGGDGNYDHIELALESPDAAGNFRTIGTNAGPNDDMAIRWRSTRYVAAFGRPAYLAPSGETGKPIGDEDMDDNDRNIVRREARARHFRNVETGQSAAVDITTGYFRRNDGGTTSAQLDAQLKRWENPYIIIGPTESAAYQPVNTAEWLNVIGEVNRYRAEQGFAKLVVNWAPTSAEMARVHK